MRYKVRYKLPLLQLHFKGCNGNIRVLRFTHEGVIVIKSLQSKKRLPLSLLAIVFFMIKQENYQFSFSIICIPTFIASSLAGRSLW